LIALNLSLRQTTNLLTAQTKQLTETELAKVKSEMEKTLQAEQIKELKEELKKERRAMEKLH